jgi:hypothetical protein
LRPKKVNFGPVKNPEPSKKGGSGLNDEFSLKQESLSEEAA